MNAVIFLIGLLLLGTALALQIRCRQSKRAREQLDNLLNHDLNLCPKSPVKEMAWEEGAELLTNAQDPFGQVGLFTAQSRTTAAWIRALLVAIFPILAVTLCLILNKHELMLIAGCGSFLLGFVLWKLYLKWKKSLFHRDLLFQLPLILESLILLAESGLGILPALQRVVDSKREKGSKSEVVHIFRFVYELAAHGIPFSQSLRMVAQAFDLKVLRHVLLHLDISGSEGGELVPALRSLSDHTHTEWKLSVEGRVKQLENAVVFPVFASVVGLICLTAAVPLVPVLELREQLNARRQVLTTTSSPQQFDHSSLGEK